MAEAVERARAMVMRAQEALRDTEDRLAQTNRLLEGRNLPPEAVPTADDASGPWYRVLSPFSLRGDHVQDLVPGAVVSAHVLPPAFVLRSLVEAGVLCHVAGVRDRVGGREA